MAGRRICAGYYRRYDGKAVYVVSTATDADTGEETVIWCSFVEVNGERKAKYKRLLNMRISAEAIERLEGEGFRGRCGKNRGGSWMKNTTPGSISRPPPTTHTPRNSTG